MGPASPPPLAQTSWRDLLRGGPGALVVEVEMGSEWAPDDPWGECVLVVRSDGGLVLDNRAMGVRRRWEGRTDVATVRRIHAAMASSSFPALVQEDFEPGATMASIRVRDGARMAEVNLEAETAAGLDGYKDAWPLLAALVAQMSGGELTSGEEHPKLPLEGWRRVEVPADPRTGAP